MISVIEKKFLRLYQLIKIYYWKIKYGRRIKIGKNLRFKRRFKVLIEKNGYLEIGDNNFFNNDCSINCLGKISIGNNNIFGENVKMYDHDHCFIDTNKIDDTYNVSTIKIGNFNWFCTNTIILRKSNVEDRNVIAAGVILNQSLDSDNIVKNSLSLKVEKIKRK